MENLLEKGLAAGDGEEGEGTGTKGPGDTSKKEPEKEQEVVPQAWRREKEISEPKEVPRTSRIEEQEKFSRVSWTSRHQSFPLKWGKCPCGIVTLITNYWQVKCAVP